MKQLQQKMWSLSYIVEKKTQSTPTLNKGKFTGFNYIQQKKQDIGSSRKFRRFSQRKNETWIFYRFYGSKDAWKEPFSSGSKNKRSPVKLEVSKKNNTPSHADWSRENPWLAIFLVDTFDLRNNHKKKNNNIRNIGKCSNKNTPKDVIPTFQRSLFLVAEPIDWLPRLCELPEGGSLTWELAWHDTTSEMKQVEVMKHEGLNFKPILCIIVLYSTVRCEKPHMYTYDTGMLFHVFFERP